MKPNPNPNSNPNGREQTNQPLVTTPSKKVTLVAKGGDEVNKCFLYSK